MSYSWATEFCDLFGRCVDRHRAGETSFANWFGAGDKALLESIGYTEQEFFDFVDDHCRYGGDPSVETALLVAAVRRDYFNVVQQGKRSGKVVPPSELPPKPAMMDGIPWLPRVMAKARAKLRGEMDPDTMYGCGGDRQFFTSHDIHPADFLRVVWAAGDDDARILNFVKTKSWA
ncbi:MAG: DUF5069 domain-containing protein [Verrucomicrobiaceae bacterium]|nr:DUF5069 domain-containing protein [Verrucomicrobiaceae bacterium]